MHNEVEVIAQTCHAATRAYSQATGGPGLPEWGGITESQRNAVRNRVTGELQRLRTSGGAVGSIAAGAATTNQGGDPDDPDSPIQTGIFNGIVRGFYEASRTGAGQVAA